MERKVIVSLSIGTAVLAFAMVLMLSAAIVVAVFFGEHRPAETFAKDPYDVYRPKTGVAKELQRSLDELKYGPVNLDAAKEVKNGGGLLSRIRERRQARVCCPQHVATIQTVQYQQPVIMDPTDCTYAYRVTPAVVSQPMGVKPAPVANPLNSPGDKPGEYPAINPLEVETSDCPSCHSDLEIEKLFRKPESRRSEVKTGAFVCANCKRPCVGDEWHTDWAEDGTPITFLCERCYSQMNPAQRLQSFKAYAARQTATNGKLALLHQEIGQ